MKVSIVIPCYNHYDFIDDAIRSAEKQTYKNKEIIIVDDCSNLSLHEQVRIEMYYTERGIRWIQHDKNLGLSAARNTGIRHAIGDLILPLDADDKIHPTYIEKAVKIYEQGTYHIISSYLETFGKYVRISRPPACPSYAEFKLANRINCCSLFSKAMWHALDGYDEKMRIGYEDYEFWCRALKSGYKVYTIQEILFYYRKHLGPSMLTYAKEKRKEIMDYMRHKGSI